MVEQGQSIHELLARPLSDIMTAKVSHVREDESFSHVAQKLVNSSIRHLPVVNANNELVGLITQRDLYKIMSPHCNEEGEWVYDLDMLEGVILKHVMINNPYALRPNNTFGDALLAMVHLKYGCIPITDDQKHICGIVTQYDVLQTFQRAYNGEATNNG